MKIKGRKDLELRIREAYGHAAPGYDAHGFTNAGSDGTEKKTPRTAVSHWTRRLALAAAAAALLLIGGLLGSIIRFPRSEKVVATVSIDVNPSLEIKLGADERVIGVTALNDDAKAVLDGMDFSGCSIEVTCNALIGAMYRLGYLNENSNSVLVTVDSGSEADSAALCTRVARLIGEAGKDNSGLSVVGISTRPYKELRALANEYGVGIHQALLIAQVIEKYPYYSFGELAELSVGELNLLLRPYNNTNVISFGEPSAAKYISHHDALQKAYVAASLPAIQPDWAWTESGSNYTEFSVAIGDKVTPYAGSEFRYAYGKMVYWVEFVNDDIKYDVRVDAVTGEAKVFKMPWDGDACLRSHDSAWISKTVAFNIALDRVGTAFEDVTDVSVDFAPRSGRMCYGISFTCGGKACYIIVDALDGSAYTN